MAFARYRYDAWGNPVAGASVVTSATTLVSLGLATDIANRQPLRYAGYAWDGATGLYYCSQRYYDPATYQWLTADPAKADGEESAYQYCGGDPVGKTDASGLYSAGRAVDYARRFALSPNPNWRYERHSWDVFKTAVGVDCASFASQCLLAGGVRTDNGWYYFRQSNGLLRGSIWWRSASDLRWWASHVSGRSLGLFHYKKNSPAFLPAAHAGDLMFFLDHGQTIHTTIVNQSNAAHGTRVAAHSSNRWNKLWTWMASHGGWDCVAVVRPS